MKAIKTKIPGVLIIETDVFGDHRGVDCQVKLTHFFVES